MPKAKEPIKRPAKTVKTSVQKPAKKVTLDDVWAGFDELRKLQVETKKSQDEAWKAIKETQRNIGGLNNSMGSLVEHFMTTGLPQKFKKLGFTFDRITTVKWADGENNIYAEIDGLLETANRRWLLR
jgi:hypothetical protein